MAEETKIVLQNVGKIDPQSIEDYMAQGGYEALKKARSTNRAQLIDSIEQTGKLRGRGGAGFNTGFKWSSAYQVDSEVKYIICNADEGEPGTFKDRTIIENDPHRVIEGILIGAYAVGAKDCYIYCRGEYKNSISLLRHAIEQVDEKGLLDGVSIRVHSGAGSYVCGEETALIESLEGKRGEPRLKPPFPTVAGFNGKPTVVNNVETFATVPDIVLKGADWFSSLGSSAYPGTKVFSLSGDVVNRGCFETTTDITLRDVIYGFGGGVPNGRAIKAIQVGGSSCTFMKPEQLDTPLGFEEMRAANASLGSGAILVIDDTHNMVDIVAKIAQFFQNESCGKCVPCREGTYRVAELLDKFASGNGEREDLEKIKKLSAVMNNSCFCALGQSATAAAISAMELFPEDFEERLKKD